MIKAEDTRPRAFYRRSRIGIIRGVYYMRPASPTVHAWAKRMRSKGPTTGRDAFHLRQYYSDPNGSILLKRFIRSRDPQTGKKTEVVHFVIFDAQSELREVKVRPVYGQEERR